MSWGASEATSEEKSSGSSGFGDGDEGEGEGGACARGGELLAAAILRFFSTGTEVWNGRLVRMGFLPALYVRGVVGWGGMRLTLQLRL